MRNFRKAGKKLTAVVLMAALALSLAGCGSVITFQPVITSKPAAAPNTSSPSTPAPAQTPKPSSTPKPTATPAPTPTPTPTPASTATLPDPYSFLFGDAEVLYKAFSGDYNMAEFLFDSSKKDAADEYAALLLESRFCMTLRGSDVSESYTTTIYTYAFDYTGSASIPHFDVGDYQDISFAIEVWEIGTYHSIGFLLAPDGFTFQDFGNRSSDKGLAAASQVTSSCNQSGGPLSAEKFNGSSGSSGSGGSSSGVPTSPPSQNKTRIPCTKCHGTGKITCSACDGKGGRNVYVNAPSYGGSSGGSSTKWEYCSKCYGSGKVTCPTCGGSGYTYY